MVHRRFSLSLLLSLATVFSISAMETRSLDDIDMDSATLEILPEMVRTDGIEEETNLFYDQEGFFVRTNEDAVRVHEYDTDKCLRGRSTKDIAKRALLGKFKVSKLDNGEYVVRSHGELKGGGPVLAGLFYWATKVGLYGAFAGAVAGSTAAVAVTGGAAAPAVAGLGAAIGTAVGTAAASAAIGGAVVTSAVAGTATVAAAVGGTALAVGATAGGAVGFITAIEAASIAAGAIGMAAGPF